jgi:hypothetical protein
VRVAGVAFLIVAALAFPGPAQAKSYRLVNADKTFRVQQDGSVKVVEQLTFSFSGTFHGAYRLIPSVGPSGSTTCARRSRGHDDHRQDRLRSVHGP